MKILQITDVKVDERFSSDEKLFIDFKVNEFPYYIILIKKKNRWRCMKAIMHDEKKEDGVCSFCNLNDGERCMKIPIQARRIAKELIEKKEIRLQLLLKGFTKEKSDFF